MLRLKSRSESSEGNPADDSVRSDAEKRWTRVPRETRKEEVAMVIMMMIKQRPLSGMIHSTIVLRYMTGLHGTKRMIVGRDFEKLDIRRTPTMETISGVTKTREEGETRGMMMVSKNILMMMRRRSIQGDSIGRRNTGFRFMKGV